MDINNMKNMIILKNLPSNMIEEAFVVLKSNVKIHKLQTSKNKNSLKKENDFSKECIIKEAELVIQEYINKIEKQNIKVNNKIKEKYKKLKALTIFLGVFSLICIILILIK